LICALALRMRLSRRRIQEFLADWLGLDLSMATINQCVHEAARAVCSSMPAATWCARAVRGGCCRRSSRLSILGPLFNGWLMSDGYGAYREFDNRLRCLAHLKRKARGLQESLDLEGRRFGKEVLNTLKAVMDSVYAAREGPPSSNLRQQHAEQLSTFWQLCRAHSEAKHEKTRALARELLNDFETFWVTLDHPELPLTNNVAERALRHWVIARRIGHGTRTAQGSRTVALLASVIETCRQRDHSPWAFIAETLTLRRQGQPAPILPAAA
jgi:hypothetical protein